MEKKGSMSKYNDVEEFAYDDDLKKPKGGKKLDDYYDEEEEEEQEYDVEEAEPTIDLSAIDIFSLARHGRFEELRQLLELGVDPNSKDKYGNTIVIIGAQNGNKQIVKLALRFGGHINMTNAAGNTALHYCSEYGYVDLGAYLMSKGANQDIINIKGFKPLQGIKPKRGLFDRT